MRARDNAASSSASFPSFSLALLSGDLQKHHAPFLAERLAVIYLHACICTLAYTRVYARIIYLSRNYYVEYDTNRVTISKDHSHSFEYECSVRVFKSGTIE